MSIHLPKTGLFRGEFVQQSKFGSRQVQSKLMAVAVVVACVSAGHAQQPQAARGTFDAVAASEAMRRAMADSASWPSYGRDYTNQRFSLLSQITTANVSQMRLAWRYRTGVPQPFEASPIVVDATMYVSLPLNHVVALDARTGQKKWDYVHPLGKTVHCCGPVNRGVAVYGGRVYMGTLDARLVALDARTGARVWEAEVDDNQRGYSITAAPLAVEGLILTGVSGGEYGIRGHISAYDARTGELRWRWHTIPSPVEGGWTGTWATTDAFGTPLNRDIAAEKAAVDKYPNAWQTGGGPVWQTPAYDPALGLIFFTVGNPSPDLDDTQRPGDNLYTDSVVAVELKTGKRRWHFQEVPHDIWDLDPASPVVLVDVRDAAGTMTPAVAQAGKSGWVYVLDRRDGRPIRRSEPFVPQENLFSRLKEKEPIRIAPGAMGGSEWSPAAWSPKDGYLFVAAIDVPMLYMAKQEPLKPPAEWWGGVIAPVKTDRPAGIFSAIDLHTGRIVWRHTTPRPLVGGALATAGGLVFTGTSDKELIALNARSGEKLWAFEAGAAVNAPPITYAIDGVQYVAVAAGGNWVINSPLGDEVLVFAVGSAATGREP